MIDGSIGYTLLECSLGHVLVAGTARGLCHVAFGDGEGALRAGLSARFPFAAPEREDARLPPQRDQHRREEGANDPADAADARRKEDAFLAGLGYLRP